MHSSPGLPPLPNGPVFMAGPEEQPARKAAASSAAAHPCLAKPGDETFRDPSGGRIVPHKLRVWLKENRSSAVTE